MNMILRTAAIVLVAGFTGFTGFAQAASSASPAGETTREIAPGIYSFAPSNYHSMFAVTDDGVAVFETVNSKHAAGLIKAVRKITDKPIKYAFHSHNHWDHASGGGVFQKLGAQTVMHKFGADWLAANPGRDTATPNVIWDGARHDISLGNLTIQMHYLGLNHGLGMTVFVIPERRIAYIADLVTPNRVMFSIVPDFNIKEWERTLGEILNLDFDVAVCSHNNLPKPKALSGCTKEHVTELRSFIRDIRKAIATEFKKGTNPGEIAATVKLPKYAHWDMYEQWLPLNVQRVLLEMWMGPYPWVPPR